MGECLSDRTLFLLREGEGTSAHRAHLGACATCARRYEQLERDLEMIGRVLREAPPPKAVPHRIRSLRLRWTAVAAGAAVTIAVVWGSVGGRRLSPPVVSAPAAPDQDVSRFLEEVTALFSTVDDGASVMPGPFSTADVLQEALEGTWPCEWPESFLPPGCDEDSLSLLSGSQEAEEVVL